MTDKNLQQVRDDVIDARNIIMGTSSLDEKAREILDATANTLDRIMGDGGWQPIKTHDKGKVKCLWGVWKDGKWYETLGTYGKNFNGSYPLVPVGFRDFELPTHWMPLPAAPKHGDE